MGVSIMESADDYRELARTCMREAAETKDDARKQTLYCIAKLYTRTALEIDGGTVPPPAVEASEQSAP